MSGSRTGRRPCVFISHASANDKTAKQIEAALEVSGCDPWLDQSDIRAGTLLSRELQKAIEACKTVVLVWSKPASASRWVATEILTAFHLDRFIIPCILSKTELPQFLSLSVHLDLRRQRAEKLEKLGDHVLRAPSRRNEFQAVRNYQDIELRNAVSSIYNQQESVLDMLERMDYSGAGKLQAKLGRETLSAEKRWPYDPTILSLAGYHHKNTYQIEHWDEYCAGRFPKDPVLDEAEKRFFDCLLVNPTDYGALNGIGNILLFKGELDAAEFFIGKAVEWAEKAGVEYGAARNDLQVIRSRRVTSDRDC